jgi:hypothetical protein
MRLVSKLVDEIVSKFNSFCFNHDLPLALVKDKSNEFTYSIKRF